MKPGKSAFVLAMVALAGCQSSPDNGDSRPPPVRPTRHEAVEITPGNPQFAARRSVAEVGGPSRKHEVILTEGDIVTFPKFVVTATGYVEYGFSVITNREVRRGGNVEWMRVGVVLPGSIAARSGLVTGDQIYAIDGVPVMGLSRDAMLSALFERGPSERPRLAVLAKRYGFLPIWVTLAQDQIPPR